jgi:hypothetical protein
MALETETGFENETETEKKIAAHISALVELLPHWDTMVYVPMTDEQANLLAENIGGDGVINGSWLDEKELR